MQILQSTDKVGPGFCPETVRKAGWRRCRRPDKRDAGSSLRGGKSPFAVRLPVSPTAAQNRRVLRRGWFSRPRRERRTQRLTAANRGQLRQWQGYLFFRRNISYKTAKRSGCNALRTLLISNIAVTQTLHVTASQRIATLVLLLLQKRKSYCHNGLGVLLRLLRLFKTYPCLRLEFSPLRATSCAWSSFRF